MVDIGSTVYRIMNQTWPDLEALESFVAVAEAGSFTAAAERLGLSKIVVSRRVTALEAGLGEKLLARTTRSLSITEAGEAVQARATRLFDAARELVDAVSSSSETPSGRLRIAAQQLLYDVLLDPVVLPFAERHPRVQLALDVAERPLESLRVGYDLALVVGPPPDSSMGSLFLGRAKLGVYAAPRYLEKHGLPRSPHDLASHAVAVAAGGRLVSWPFSKAGKSVSVTLAPRFSFGSHDLVMRAVTAGVAIGRLPHFYVKRAGARGRVEPILLEWSCPPVAAYAVFPNRERPSPSARAFLAELRERLSRRA